MKEAGTKVCEPVEGEIKTLQGCQVVQLFTSQPREKIVAEEMNIISLFKVAMFYIEEFGLFIRDLL